MPDGCVYVFCGLDQNLQSDHGVMVYDIEEDAWDSIPLLVDLGKFREAAALDEYRILLAGGSVIHPLIPEAECVIFDIRAKNFYSAEPLPYPLGFGTMVRKGGSLYYIGGYDGADTELSINVLRYDIARGAWELCGRMSEPHIAGEGVLAGDGLVYLYGSIVGITGLGASNALDLRDCSLHHCPQLPFKSTGGGMAATEDGRVIVFGGEDDNIVSRDVHSLTVYGKEAWLGEEAVGPGGSVRVYASIEGTCFECSDLTATAYLIKDGTTYSSCRLEAIGNGTASGLLVVPEDLGPGEYQVLITDVDTGVGVPGMINYDPLPLTVTGSPTPTDRLAELQDQLSSLRDELNETRAELADLQDSSDGKMDAWVGYVLVALAAAILAVSVLALMRRK